MGVQRPSHVAGALHRPAPKSRRAATTSPPVPPRSPWLSSPPLPLPRPLLCHLAPAAATARSQYAGRPASAASAWAPTRPPPPPPTGMASTPPWRLCLTGQVVSRCDVAGAIPQASSSDGCVKMCGLWSGPVRYARGRGGRGGPGAGWGGGSGGGAGRGSCPWPGGRETYIWGRAAGEGWLSFLRGGATGRARRAGLGACREFSRESCLCCLQRVVSEKYLLMDDFLFLAAAGPHAAKVWVSTQTPAGC